ncbi:MAG: hypothetical protein PHT37_07715 [Candidatus Cloacimonetes bacterium]|jgi:hypothetical protein|nr:hypothetical protein [Candidatus Cloacimonadota bacterium]MDD2424063.1 hypothetical protein [Candidatus Cloacimonadota bacterium]MDD4277757.1 hypothetical protein [Candidatus Cloacimonadota bacterium]MDY0325225.1 hypothetical protein [Candidatus Cloacimonadaceae bacterium]
MKQILIIIVVAILCLPLFGQEINSFRNLSTAGVLDDDADLAFDTIELNYLNGTHIFSNLSNFSGTDKILSSSGSQHLLLGIASDKCFIDNFRRALLIKYYDYKTPGSIQYDSDLWGSMADAMGEVDYTWQEYSNTNGNGLYDQYRILQQHIQNMDYSKGMDIYLNLAYELNKTNRLGFKLGILKSETGHTRNSTDLLGFAQDSPSTNYRNMLQTLPESDPSVMAYLAEDKKIGDFKTEQSFSNTLAELAYGRTMNTYDLRAALEFRLIDDKTTHDDTATEIEIRTNQPNSIEMESYLNKLGEKGIHAAFSLGVRKNFSTAAERKNSAYIALGAGMGFQNLDITDNETMTMDYKTSGQFHEYGSFLMKQDGEKSGLEANVHLRINYPLNDKTYFGTGLRYHYSNSKQKGDFVYNMASTDSTFSSPNGAWSATETCTALISGKTEHNYDSTTFSVPVGLEYWFTNNQHWAFRLGSLFTQNISSVNELYQPKNVEPYTCVLVNANGAVPYITYADNDYVIESKNQVTRSSSTSYCYGIGYKPSSNLQIDIMGVFDSSDTDLWNTDFFRNLRLAFSLRL